MNSPAAPSPAAMVMAALLLATGAAPAADSPQGIEAYPTTQAVEAARGQVHEPPQPRPRLVRGGAGADQAVADDGAEAGGDRGDARPLRVRDLWHQHRVAGTLLAGSVFLVAALLLLLAHRNRQLEGNAQALKTSEERFRSLFARSSSVMLLVEPESGRIEDANPAAADFYGHPLERLVGMAMDDINLLPPEAVAVERRKAETEERRHFHFQHRLANGEVRDVEVYSTPIRSATNTLLFSIIHDITERKRTQDSLAMERRRLQNVIEGTRAATWEWNIQTGKVVLSPRWAEMLGYTLEALQPLTIDTWMELTHPEDLARSQNLLQRHFAGELDSYECEIRMRHRDGHWVWVQDRGQVMVRAEDGSPWWMAGTHIDISERRRAEEDLRTLSDHFMTLLDNATDFIYFKDADSRFIFASQTLAALTGHDHWKAMVGKHDRDVFPPDMARVYEKEETPVFRNGVSLLNCVEPYYDHQGNPGWVSTNKWPVVDPQSGAVAGLCGISRDVTEQQRTEERLRLAASVFTHAREGIFITDAAGAIIEVNDAFCHITGYPREEALGQNPRILSSGRHDEAFYASLWQALETKGHWYGEIWNRRRDGEVYAALLTISMVGDAGDEARRYVALFSDITSQKEQQRRLEHIAHYDALTELPNRVLLGDRLKHAMAQAHRRGQRLAVVFLDLDGFKEINDSHGHEVGDQLLITIARRLLQGLRESDTIARLGGDEFVAVLNDITDDQSGAAMLGRLLGAAAQPIIVEGRTLQVTASAGVAYYPQTEEVDADQLLRQADQAMYRSKLAGKNCYQVFDAEQDRATRGHHEGIERIARALDHGELELHYQPKVNMRSGQVMGVEALVRWRHPERGLLAPAQFLPLIENHALDLQVGDWVLATALQQLDAWQAEGLRLAISINISALQLQQSDFATRLRAAFRACPTVAPEMLELEVLETAALEDMAQVSEVMGTCQDLGVHLTLDDFGTGYSSLTYFKRLPASQIKIDRSFVRDMLEDPEDLAILEGVLGLATAFGRTAIAEGVETVAHGSLLLQLGYELAQGFAIARPMPATAVPGWVANWRPFPEWTRQRAVSRDDLSLLFAIVEHRAWGRALEEYLEGRRPAPPPLDHHQCRFGQWLDREQVQRQRQRPDFHAIVDLHREAHVRAREIIALKEDNRDHEVVDGLEAFKTLRDELVERLQALAQPAEH